MAVLIASVAAGGRCAQKQIAAGDTLCSINGHKINDFLDYQFYSAEPSLRLVVRRQSGGVLCCVIHKDPYENLGLSFADYLMDETRRCTNRCVFCFVDQMPQGMRPSLYLKDDDARLSFLFGNYITLTNLSSQEIERIITMRISPINISVHTTNPALRERMMGNCFAGGCLSLLQQLAAANITMNCQLVLCPGVNDGAELRRSLSDLVALFPAVQSIACVPVGLTRYREGLPSLTPYQQEQATQVVEQVHAVAAQCLQQHGRRLCYLADEFYLRAALPIPQAEYYESFLQLENGVGMMALMEQEYFDALASAVGDDHSRNLAVATGVDAAPFLARLIASMEAKFPHTKVAIYGIENRLFGDTITVAGLLTGQNLIDGLAGCPLGDTLLIPDCMLRHEQDAFLDDLIVTDLAQALGVEVVVCPVTGEGLLQGVLSATSPQERENTRWQNQS